MKVEEGSHQRTVVSRLVGHGSEGGVDGGVEGVSGDVVLGGVVEGDEGFEGGLKKEKEKKVRTREGREGEK